MSNIWKSDEPLILASSSVTRLQVLKAIGLPVQPESPDVNERGIEQVLRQKHAPPDQIALELAKAKAADVSRRVANRWILAADQTLALGKEQFHKPKSLEQASMQLIRLAGRTHQLHSAVVCYRDGECRFEHVDTASLTMRAFGPGFLQAYLAEAGEAVTKSVGAYQVEGLGLHLFEKIEGDHFTILGLPLFNLLSFFRASGLVAA